MNTHEARSRLGEIGHRAIGIIERLRDGASPSFDDRTDLRQLAAESRVLLAEAGFPGEAVWRGLTRASMGVDTSLSASDPYFWQDVLDGLIAGTATLDDLVSPPVPRDADFRIVG